MAQRVLTEDQIREKEFELLAAKRLLAVSEAQNSMRSYMRLIRHDPEAPSDPDRSAFKDTVLAHVLCQIVEKVERGELKRVAVSVGPQFGKSEILSRGAPAWIAGRKPSRNLMLGTYNQDFAEEFGAEVRDIVKSAAHQQVFPEHKLKKGGQASDLLISDQRGKTAFVGVGGSGTGKPADFFFVDDPIRSDDDARSATYRERIWKWFNSVVFTRCHGESGIIVVHTRWHQDDLIGRLCDPDHPERKGKYAGIAENWTYINIPAVITDPKLAAEYGLELEVPTDPSVIEQFCPVNDNGEEQPTPIPIPMTSLWPGRKPLSFLAEAKRMDARVFSALYMGNPAPEEGAFFKKHMLLEYERRDLPKNLKIYGASDHAVTTKQTSDPHCIGTVGVDEDNNIWVLPGLNWKRMDTAEAVRSLVRFFKTGKPQTWFMESENIAKAFGPFLVEEMKKKKVYTYIKKMNPSKDKVTRAQSIQGRMELGTVYFPKFAPWWEAARKELLNFPYGANDDFVDFMSLIGQGLGRIVKPSTTPKPTNDNEEPPVGSIEWIMQESAAQEERANAQKDTAGW